ncbi:MAG TPA: type I phosphomannose isomerase catalytic subunit [Trueperaceae bacterium]
MNEPYPLLLERRLSRRLWGGSQMADYLGIEDAGGDEPLAESWQVYEGNEIRNGEFAGRTLAEVAHATGAWLLGTASLSRYGTKVPLLAKFIDAAKPLSIQVHPDDEYARRFEPTTGHLGKAEAWYIISCAPGAQVVWGFQGEMSEGRVRQAVADGDLERYLKRVRVAPGDVIYNPVGTVHAIGAGILLFEIQQASDLTYRLYDYGRRDAQGRERELHLEQALAVMNYDEGGMPKVMSLDIEVGRRLLVESEHFGMEAVEPQGRRLRLGTSPASLEILTVTNGRIELGHPTGALELATGTSVVLPAALGEYRLEGEGQILRCYVPVV